MPYYTEDNDPDWDSEYDSTWEEEEPPKKKKTYVYNSQKRAAKDMQNYRHGYPNNCNASFGGDAYPQEPQEMPNLMFYRNLKPFEPDGEIIQYIHTEWKEDYDTLEYNHSYIQWLFPLQEQGVNWRATPLSKRELEIMRNESEVRERLLTSYELMLGFYGIKLQNSETGEVTRANNWEKRFSNLNNHTHNNLRITRILKCLGEMGFAHFQAPLVRFFLEETLRKSTLRNVKKSVLDYFMFTVKDKKQRQELVHFAWENYGRKPNLRFVWGPDEKLQKYKWPADNKQAAHDRQNETYDRTVDEEAKPNGLLNHDQNHTETGPNEHASLDKTDMEDQRDTDINHSEVFSTGKGSQTKPADEGLATISSERNDGMNAPQRSTDDESQDDDNSKSLNCPPDADAESESNNEESITFSDNNREETLSLKEISMTSYPSILSNTATMSDDLNGMQRSTGDVDTISENGGDNHGTETEENLEYIIGEGTSYKQGEMFYCSDLQGHSTEERPDIKKWKGESNNEDAGDSMNGTQLSMKNVDGTSCVAIQNLDSHEVVPLLDKKMSPQQGQTEEREDGKDYAMGGNKKLPQNVTTAESKKSESKNHEDIVSRIPAEQESNRLLDKTHNPQEEQTRGKVPNREKNGRKHRNCLLQCFTGSGESEDNEIGQQKERKNKGKKAGKNWIWPGLTLRKNHKRKKSKQRDL